MPCENHHVLTPSLPLDRIFGPGTLYSNRPSDHRSRWLLQDLFVREALSAALLSVAGTMPMLCARRAVTPLARRLMERAGLTLESPIHTYESAADFPRVLQGLSRQYRIVVTHILAPDELPSSAYWIPPSLMSHLNDKANLAGLAGEENVPTRSIHHPGELASLAVERWPLVLKASTSDSTAGGYDVRIVENRKALEEAARFFAPIERVVVEEYLEIATSYCVSFAVDHEGRIHEVGSAEEVISPEGRHAGNWIESEHPTPRRVFELVRPMIEKARALGYVGWAGVDVALTRDGRTLVIDPNFRGVSSNMAVLLFPALRERFGVPIALRSRRWRFPNGLSGPLPRIEDAIDAGRLVPLVVCDAGPESFLYGLLVSRERGTGDPDI